MSYKALYRTYRPSSFDDVVGQRHVVLTLQNVVRKDKIAHAYLFCGPRGTGKTTIAKILAKAVNCENRNEAPCNQCASCLSIQKGNHTDIIEIDAASNNGVDEIRDLIEKVKYAPIESKYKVYIIDEVHMLSAGAFNALLKTLEEPPSHVIFVLATTEPHKILPTIISRCQRYDFTKVEIPDIIGRIEMVLKEENVTCEKEAIKLIASLADGGMRDSLSILEQCIAYADNNITLEQVNEIYGITTIEEKINLIINISNQETKKIISTIKHWQEKGVDIKRLTSDIIDVLKDIVIFGYTKDDELLTQVSRDEAAKVHEKLSATYMLLMIEVLIDTLEKYKNASNAFAYFEVAILKMISLSKEKSPITVVNEIDKKEIIVPKKVINVDIKEEKQINEPEILVCDDEIVINNEAKAVSHKNYIDQELSVDTILRLMVQANKQEKIKDNECWKLLDKKSCDLSCAKQANILKGSNIAVSGELFVILETDYQALVNEINEMKDELQDFMCHELFINKNIFICTKAKIIEATQEFIEKRKLNSLPEPLKLEAIKTDLKEEVKIEENKTDKEIMTSLFGNDFEIKEEK